MANNVNFKVSFEQLNEAATAKLKEMFTRFQDDDCNFGDMFVDGKAGSPSYEDTNAYNWYNENVGAKWCYIEEYDSDYLFGRSAWAAPEAGLQWLANQLAKLDEDLIMNVSYEDEGPNFVGWMVFSGDEIWEEDYQEDDHFLEIVQESYPDVTVDTSEDYEEVLWESIMNWQHKNFNRIDKDIINFNADQLDE
jgi:hypothetical protein